MFRQHQLCSSAAGQLAACSHPHSTLLARLVQSQVSHLETVPELLYVIKMHMISDVQITHFTGPMYEITQ